MALTWDEIVERGKQFNKTVICEVEKRGKNKVYRIVCNNCLDEKLKPACNFNVNCWKCFPKYNKSNSEEFILKSKKIHGNKFDYSLVEYINSCTKVKIICNTCNKIFEQIPSSHLRGKCCLYCSKSKLKNTKNNFIHQSSNIHGNKFDYSLVEYINTHTKVKIICNTCNKIFEQRPSGHLCGYGCPYCGKGNRLSNTDDFVLKCKNLHGDKYNYKFVDYLHSLSEVRILCNKCTQIFEQKPTNHLSGSGCPRCRESKGETKIARYLSVKNVRFISQKSFSTLRNKNPLKYDFYLNDLNLLIEYDGVFHYKALIGTTPEQKQKNLEDCQRRDKIKDDWAKANNIPLLRIPYWDYDRIEELIEAFILQHTKKEIVQLSLEI